MKTREHISILLIFLVFSNFCSADSSISIDVKLSSSKIKKNDMVFLKTIIINNSNSKKTFFRKIGVSHGTLRFKIKRPNQKEFKIIHPYGFKMAVRGRMPYDAQMKMKPGDKHIIYSSIFSNKNGHTVFSESGNYKLAVEVCQEKGCKKWIRSDSVKLQATQKDALVKKTVKKNKSLIKKLPLSVSRELLPKPEEISQLNVREISESNFKHYIKFIRNIVTQIDRNDVNKSDLIEKANKLKSEISPIVEAAVVHSYNLNADNRKKEEGFQDK